MHEVLSDFYERGPSNLTGCNNYTVKEHKFPFSRRNPHCTVWVSRAVIKMGRFISPSVAPWQPFYGKCICSACFSEGAKSTVLLIHSLMCTVKMLAHIPIQVLLCWSHMVTYIVIMITYTIIIILGRPKYTFPKECSLELKFKQLPMLVSWLVQGLWTVFPLTTEISHINHQEEDSNPELRIRGWS